MSDSVENPDFSFVGDGELTDDAIAALAGLLLDLVDRDVASGVARGQASADPNAKPLVTDRNEKATTTSRSSFLTST